MKTSPWFRSVPGMVFFVLFLLAALSLSAQDRGLSVRAQDGTTLTSFSGSYALVIGESRYTNGWPSLSGVSGDTAAIKRLLEEQGFTVETLENKASRELRSGIEAFFDRYGYSRDVRLLIYYAGHGHTLKLDHTRDMGYIVPVDAPLPTRDETGFKRLAIAMQQFDTWAKQIESRHVLFVFDSCFSGSIFATSRAAPGIIDYKIASPVRLFISSGGANETVPDVSVFRQQMEAALRNREADYNKDGYVSGSELGDFLQSTVVNYSNNSQHPQYGKIRDPSLDKGDFIFSVGLPAAAAMAVPPQPVIEPGPVTVASGSLEISTVTAGALEIRGPGTSQQLELPAWGTLPIDRINAGTYTLTMNYAGGKTETKTVEVGRSAAVKAEFTYRPAPVQPPVQPPAGSVPAPQPAVNQKQSSGAVIGYGALNLALGLGSFIQRDWAGGATLLAGYGAAVGLIAWELSLNYEDDLTGVPGAIGIGAAGLTAVYGFIRPAVYQRNRRLAGITDRINIAVVPGNRGEEAVQLSYTLKF